MIKVANLELRHQLFEIGGHLSLSACEIKVLILQVYLQ